MGFCCEGCKTVYSILNKNNLCDYYSIDVDAPRSLKDKKKVTWSAEELNLMVDEFTLSEDKDNRTVLLYTPSIHCSSCIWLLEKLPDLNSGVLECRTDFLKKQLRITYNPHQTSFGSIVLLLHTLGYEPSLMPEDEGVLIKSENRKTLLKLGVAGFCAGNIMMFSFPEYLGLNIAGDEGLLRLFHVLNIALSIPLVFYSGQDYFRSFYHWLKYRTLSVKVPLAIGIGALWLRSVYEASTNVGSGYFDSLAGLIFLLITGSWLQNRVFDSLRFGEKASKFFPLVARTVVGGKLVPRKVIELLPGDRVRILAQEIIPADGILMGTDALIEYSYATGESAPLNKVAGEVLYGGGRNLAGTFEMEVIRPFDSGRLSEIWNAKDKETERSSQSPDFEVTISRYFILGTLLVAFAAFVYWSIVDPSQIWFAVIAVLMVACPCALALAPPFAYNLVAGFFARKGLYLKKPEITGKLGQIDDIIFDKTGTLTKSRELLAHLPQTFTVLELQYIKSIASQSNHPYSQAIDMALLGYENLTVQNFKEHPGKGTEAVIKGEKVRLGSFDFTSNGRSQIRETGKQIWVSIGDKILEPIIINDVFRSDLSSTLAKLTNTGYQLVIASGDKSSEQAKITSQYPGIFSQLFFECSPSEKTALVGKMQKKGHVLMVGDGLNDAGALLAGDVGMVITDNTNNFTPEASAILLDNSFHLLPDFLRISKKANTVVKQTFLISLIYNLIALSLAFSGHMSPLIAAILMPTSSVILMLYAWGKTKYILKREDNL